MDRSALLILEAGICQKGKAAIVCGSVQFEYFSNKKKSNGQIFFGEKKKCKISLYAMMYEGFIRIIGIWKCFNKIG